MWLLTPQETIGKYQPDWKRLSTAKESIKEEDKSELLIGLAGSPPTTIYSASALVNFERSNVVEVELPVFRTKENEIVEFETITYEVEAFTRTNTDNLDWLEIIVDILYAQKKWKTVLISVSVEWNEAYPFLSSNGKQPRMLNSSRR